MEFTCAILAGGRSKRMGRDKATLRVSNKALIQQVYDKAKPVFRDVLIVSNHHEGFYGIDAPIVKDLIPVRSSMVGIVSALMAARNPYVFVLACDMPFVSKDAIEYLLGQVHGEDIIVPRTKYGYEPLHAIYNRSCIPFMLTNIERRRLKVRDLFPYLSVNEVENESIFFHKGVSVFTNINVQEDLSLVRRLSTG
ncbi:MAG: putative molybdenum cofactor guanylyltransferase [Syntrophorhabdus sp. PtaU1.Bin153]|nr:MAG: putative molybdenum cofactor guanylyltransferase [Syntrophorhabdus sp. PtaU1.Bin153]